MKSFLKIILACIILYFGGILISKISIDHVFKRTEQKVVIEIKNQPVARYVKEV